MNYLRENLSFDQAGITITESEERDGKKSLYMNGICIQGGIRNANQRVYPVNEIGKAVKTLNDQPLFRGDFKGSRGFSLHQGLKVLAGRPDRVQVQIGAAESQPLGPISPIRWQTFAASKPPAANKPAAIAPRQTSQEKAAKPNGAAPATPSPDVPRAAPAP